MAIGNPITLTSNVSSKTITTTATAGQTNFTISGGYRINQISVFRNGVKLASDDYQARDGSTVILTVGANNGDTLEFQIFDDFRVANSLDVNTGGSIGGSLSVNGSVTATSFVGNLTGTATTALGLSGTPNITAGVVTATSFVGSGASLTSLNASNISSGIVSTTRLATGTADNTTYLRGDQTWSSVPSGFSNMQVFTSPGTFTVPPTTTKVKVTVTGGGGAGGSIPFNPGSNAAGTGGGTGIAIINISGPTSIPVTVGAAGIPAAPGVFTPGGTSSFGTYVSATGGVAVNYVSPSPTGTAGGSASFPQPAPTYQSTLNIFGGSINSFLQSSPFGPGPAISVSGGNSYWGSSGPTSAYGAGTGQSLVPPSTSYYYPAGAGVVVVEW